MAAPLAVVWRDDELGSPAIGRLELHPGCLHLEGERRGQPVSEDVVLATLLGAHFGRAERERIGARQTLLLELINRHCPLLVSSVFGIGVLAELAELLAG
jgi:hypothetical protein